MPDGSVFIWANTSFIKKGKERNEKLYVWLLKLLLRSRHLEQWFPGLPFSSLFQTLPLSQVALESIEANHPLINASQIFCLLNSVTLTSTPFDHLSHDHTLDYLVIHLTRNSGPLKSQILQFCFGNS